MVNILPEYFESNESQIDIQVVLATYNGEKYLTEFLESLLKQQRVHIRLLVSDDGSTDGTMKILESFLPKFDEFRIVFGPQKGPAANFYSLLRQASGDYIALADQDDIWEPQHLINSIQRIDRYSAQPEMSYSSTITFGDPESSGIIWPKSDPIERGLIPIFQNYARGCTIVINRSALALLTEISPKKEVMHDWWIYIMIYIFGEVRFGLEPEVRYRIHDNNTVGLGKVDPFRALRVIRNRTWQPYSQLMEFESIVKSNSNNERARLISTITDAIHGSIKNRIRLILGKQRFRDTIFGEIKIRFIFLFFPLLRLTY